MLRTFALAAALAGVAATAAPANATLRYCRGPVDVFCYSQQHDMNCQVYVPEKCGNVNVPSLDEPVCAFHPICDDIHELIKGGVTHTGS